jgi:hypothetical protein
LSDTNNCKAINYGKYITKPAVTDK